MGENGDHQVEGTYEEVAINREVEECGEAVESECIRQSGMESVGGFIEDAPEVYGVRAWMGGRKRPGQDGGTEGRSEDRAEEVSQGI